jgi:hypothetical protein
MKNALAYSVRDEGKGLLTLMQLDYRDHVTELLTTIGACGIAFDITVNYDLTKLYLEVVSFNGFCRQN